MATIICDLDDCVLDFTGTWRRIYKEWFDVTPRAQTDWDDPMGFPRFQTKDEFFNWFNWIRGWDEIGYVPGAPGGLWDLLRAGFVVRFVTARHGVAADSAVRWWKRSPWHSKTFMHTNVHDKTLVKGHVHIDDRPKYVNDAVAAGRGAVLFDRPWNQKDIDERVVRVRDWRSATLWARGMARGEELTDVEGD